MVPHAANAGLAYADRRLNAYVNFAWRDSYPSTVTGTLRYFRHRGTIDIGGGLRLSKRASFFFSARDLLSVPYLLMNKLPGNPDVLYQEERNGVVWTFGIKSVW